MMFTIIRWSRVAAIAGALFAAGCASEDPGMDADPAMSGCIPGSLGCPTAAAGSTAAGSGVLTGGTGGTGVITMMAGSTAMPLAGTGSITPSTGGSVPCDVAEILGDHCSGCHQNPTKVGAPMPLLTVADFQAAAKSDATKKVYQVIPARLDPTDPTKRMPQPPLPALDDAQKSALNAWLTAGAPAMPEQQGCAVQVKELMPVGMEAGTGGTMEPVVGGSGRAHIEPIEYDDPEMVCYTFQTHARGDMDAPFVQGFGEAYYNFDFEAPWTGTVYQRAAKIANDPNSQVLHHWLFFKQSGRVTDGAVGTSIGAHPDGTLIHAWGPGASPIYLDPDVGVPLPSDVGYRLEAHLNNAGGGSGEDKSGIELCVTPKEPEHIAELVWVGTDGIAGSSATGNCNPRGPFPIQIIAAQPHMHKLGTHMKVTVNRAGGGEDIVHDLDFSFDSQQYYVKDFVLEDGDTMTTECSYSGFATFGTSTESEMCYFFSLAWPAGSLRGGGGALLHGPNSCM